jgi:UDP-N-acetylmuramoylalanine--D-glutamate ligase
MKTWNEVRILVIGAARQGLALARFLARSGADVTLNDKRTPDQLQAVMQEMEAVHGVQVHWALGDHPLSLLDTCDLVCVSGGVPLDLPLVQAAKARGIPLTNDSEIFLQAVPCRVIGITGSAGKTTTTTLVGRIAGAEVKAPNKAWVGGNIGLPLIDHLDEIRADDTVILELSSFQLELMEHAPHVAAVTNITPNHLDRHGTLEAYAAAKAHILDFQSGQDIAVLNREDPGSWGLKPHVHGRLVSFGLHRPQDGQAGTYLEEGALWYQDLNGAQRITSQAEIELRGQHNLYNVLAAFAIAAAADFSIDAMATGLKGFRGVAHRLELVREWNGALWYNCSISTAPERTMADIRVFDEPLVLMLGGKDKNLPWDELAELVRQRVDHVVIFGDAAGKIAHALGSAQPGQRPYTIDICRTFLEAMQAAGNVANPGDVVLLSPGATSYDEFRDFEERGEVYRKWLNERS